MTIYVDELLPHNVFGHVYWCHMWTDNNIEELHKFAVSIGLKREWFQEHKSMPHYDITDNKRKQAIQKGAKAVNFRELIRMVKERRNKK